MNYGYSWIVYNYNDIYPNQLVIDLCSCVFIGSLLTEGLDLDDNGVEYCKIKNKFVQFWYFSISPGRQKCSVC